MCRLRIAVALAILTVLCFLAQGCGGGSPFSPLTRTETLLSAPLEVDIEGRTYTLETMIYLNLELITENRLTAIVYVTAADGQPFPESLDAIYLWVINGDKTWKTEFSAEARPRDQSHLYQLGEVAGGGPEWEEGTNVEVIIKVTTTSGSTYLLRATAQRIGVIA
jgi:hypothetical protein